MTGEELKATALQILTSLGFPRGQLNERSALCLLALAGLRPGQDWHDAQDILIGTTPIMDFMREHFGKVYKPNSREAVRRRSLHQFRDAGLALYNPDDPGRAVNSQLAAYQLAPEALALLRTFSTDAWAANPEVYLGERETLAARYANERALARLPVKLLDGREILLSAGEHSELIKAIVEGFSSRFVPGGQLVYVGDTGDKVGYFDEALLRRLGVTVDRHGKMPDAIIYDTKRNWLVLAEAVTSHGPVDGKRRDELKHLFGGASAGLVYVTAFPTRRVMAKYLSEVAWETEVWVADAPTHLVHFNGVRFLGPYDR